MAPQRALLVALFALAPTSDAWPQQSRRVPPSGGPAATVRGGEDLTVRFVVGNGVDGFDPVPQAGYTLLSNPVVTLVGTTTNCSGRAVAFCDGQGRARFEGVVGPFTVTGQVDFVDPDEPSEKIRAASTLFGLRPPGGEIVLPIFADENDVEGDLDAFVSGTVTGIPPLGAGSLRVEYSTRADGPDFNWFTTVDLDPKDPSIGTYGLSVPSDVVLDFALVREMPGGMPLEAKLRLDRGPFFGSPTLNFDYSQGTAIPFSSTSATYSNHYPGVDFQAVFVKLEGPPQREVEISLFLGFPGALPSTLFVPPTSHPGMLGLVPSIEVEQYQSATDLGANRDEELAATSYDFDMLGAPSLALPGTLSTAAANALQFTYGEGPGAQADQDGANFIDIESKDPGLPGIDFSVWQFILRPGETSFALPPTALPMFGPGGEFEFTLGTSRLDVPVDFDDFFDSGFESELAALEAAITRECDSEAADTLQTLPDVLLVPVSVLRLVGPANSGVASPRTATEADTLLTLALYVDRLNEVFSQAGIRFIADRESLAAAADGAVIDVSAAPMVDLDSSGWIEAFPCTPSCAPDDCDELTRLSTHLLGQIPGERVVLAPVGNMERSRDGHAPDDILGATQVNCPSNADPCLDGCALTNGTVYGDGRLLSLLQDDGAGNQEDANGFVVAHEVGHQLDLCHTDLDVAMNNLMAAKCQAEEGCGTKGGRCITCHESLCTPVTCPLQNLTPAQITRIQSVVGDF